MLLMVLKWNTFWVGEGATDTLVVVMWDEENVEVVGGKEVVDETVVRETGPSADTTPAHRAPVK